MKTNLNLQDNLDQDQYSAVVSTEPRLLCMANAGSGKTRMLTFRAANFIANGVPEQNIMMLTFTKKAANEMRQRIAGLLETNYLKITAGTFHSVACRLIRQYAHYAGIDGQFAIFDTDVTKLWLQNALSNIQDENPEIKKLKDRPTAAFIQKEYSYCRNTGLNFNQYIQNVFTGEEVKAEICIDAVQRYETVKSTTPALDFDDLLLTFARMLQNPEFRALMNDRYRAVFVDEYQDINIIQHEIIKNLAGPNTWLTVVGDDAQCIYGFRGSNVDFIQNFKADFENAAVIYLPKNYRSSENIVRDAGRVLNESIYHAAEKKEMTAVRTDTCPDVKYLYTRDEDSQAEYITIQCICAKARMNWSDMAILVRTKADANRIEAELLKAGIPVSKECGIEFYKKEQINIVVRFLQFLHMPNDKAAFAKFAAKCPKIGQKTIDKLFDEIKAAGFDVTAAANIKAPGSNKNILFDAMLASMKTAQDILKSGHSEPKLLAEDFIDEFVKPYCKLKYGDVKEELQTRLLEVEQLVEQLEIYPTLDSFLENAILDMSQEDNSDNLDNPENKKKSDRVRIMTIHKSKGLEFKKVFLPSMSQGIVPSNKQEGIESEMQEELRVIYVAMTRAMNELDIIAIQHCIRVQNAPGVRAALRPSEFFDGMLFQKV